MRDGSAKEDHSITTPIVVRRCKAGTVHQAAPGALL